MRKILLPLFAVLILTACQKETVSELAKPQEETATAIAAKGTDKITIWHYNATYNTWKLTTINASAWADHQAHGDIWKVGQDYKGGKIGYILQQGDPGYNANVPHGLIAAASDQSEGIPWNNGSWIVTGATGFALGTGRSNTNLIVSVQGSGNYAAKLCADLVLNNYDDWYLPSSDELYFLYINRDAIGGFSGIYWSSSEYDIYGAFILGFYSGEVELVLKELQFKVRPVRSF